MEEEEVGEGGFLRASDFIKAGSTVVRPVKWEYWYPFCFWASTSSKLLGKTDHPAQVISVGLGVWVTWKKKATQNGSKVMEDHLTENINKAKDCFVRWWGERRAARQFGMCVPEKVSTWAYMSVWWISPPTDELSPLGGDRTTNPEAERTNICLRLSLEWSNIIPASEWLRCDVWLASTLTPDLFGPNSNIKMDELKRYWWHHQIKLQFAFSDRQL